MIDPRRLLVFRTVLQYGSFSAASDALRLTQPSISRQVALLEREVGLLLVERTGRGLKVTDAGAELLKSAEVIAGQLAAADASLRDLQGLAAGAVTLACFPTAAATFALDAVAIVRREHPGIELSLIETTASRGVASVLAGDLAIALSFDLPGEPPSDQHPALERLELFGEPMLAALPHDHARSRQRQIALAELAKERWVVGTTPGGLIERACSRAGFSPTIAARADTQSVIQRIVAMGMAVTLIPAVAAKDGHPDIAFRPLADPAITREVIAVVRAASPRPPAIKAVLDALGRVSAGERSA